MKRIVDPKELDLLVEDGCVLNRYGLWIKNISGRWWLGNVDWDFPEKIVPCYLIEEGDFD